MSLGCEPTTPWYQQWLVAQLVPFTGPVLVLRKHSDDAAWYLRPLMSMFQSTQPMQPSGFART